MLIFDRKKFFDGFKKRFDNTLNQSQTDGIDFLLDHFENEPLWNSIPRLAYAWATVFHETAGSMQPVEEAYYIGEKYGQKRMLEIQKGFRYYPFFGRGFVQLTWETKRIPNYSKATREIRKQRPQIVEEFEAKTGKKFDLVKYPDQAKDPIIAFAVMTLGMFQGWFTGKNISTFIDNRKADFFNARTVINGHDKATVIAMYARNFVKCLEEALITGLAPVEKTNSAVPVLSDESSSQTNDSSNGQAIGSSTNPEPPHNPEPEPPAAPVNQIADTIVNNGAPTPPTESVTLTAPAADQVTAKTAKATVFGLAVPTFIYTGFKTVEDYVAKGYIKAEDLGNAAMTFAQNNFKWIAGAIALYIVLLMIQKLAKQITFWITMLTHAMPSWNNVEVRPAPIVQPKPTVFGLLWNVIKGKLKTPSA